MSSVGWFADDIKVRLGDSGACLGEGIRYLLPVFEGEVEELRHGEVRSEWLKKEITVS